jgi:hypothetical protein
MSEAGLSAILPWVIMVGTIVATWLVLTKIKRRNAQLEWWKQLFLIMAGYLMIFILGALLIAPTGPGSDRIVYVLLLAYSCCLLLFGSRLVRIVALLLGAVLVVGVILSTAEKRDFQQRIQDQGGRYPLETEGDATPMAVK